MGGDQAPSKLLQALRRCAGERTIPRDSSGNIPSLNVCLVNMWDFGSRSEKIFEALVPAIIQQRVVGIQATASWRHLVRKFGSPAPGLRADSMMVVPTPQVWATIPDWVWHQAGIDPRRARTVRTIAGISSSLESLVTAARPEALTRLSSLPGMGR